MSIRTLLVLSVVLAVAFGENYMHTQNISLGVPFTGNFGPWNLRTTANFTVTHTVPVVVCIVPTEFGLPSEVQYAADVCTFFQSQGEAGAQSVSLALLHTNYTFGVYYQDTSKKVENSTVTVQIEAETCPEGDFYDNQDCVKAEVFHSTNETFHKDYTKGETAFFTYVAPARVSHFKAVLHNHNAQQEPEDFVITARYNGPALVEHDYIDTNLTITADLPHRGTWVFAVHANNPGSASFSLDVEECPAGHAGVDCSVIPPAMNKADLVITSTGDKSIYYYYFQATPKQGLLVSVFTPNHVQIPFLYATRDQLPDVQGKNADIKNCNGGFCNTVRSIAHNVTVDEDWYIAVVTNLTSGNTTFGIWFNTTCVFGCETDNRGTCNPDGTCDCQIDYEGIDCSISKGLGPHYIVLIIIASLVVASAVIGFVAWAYMRRKRQNYEILT